MDPPNSGSDKVPNQKKRNLDRLRMNSEASELQTLRVGRNPQGLSLLAGELIRRRLPTSPKIVLWEFWGRSGASS